jgi:hypothetical protein
VQANQPFATQQTNHQHLPPYQTFNKQPFNQPYHHLNLNNESSAIPYNSFPNSQHMKMHQQPPPPHVLRRPPTSYANQQTPPFVNQPPLPNQPPKPAANTLPCSSIVRGDPCKNGSNCRFSHDSKAIQLERSRIHNLPILANVHQDSDEANYKTDFADNPSYDDDHLLSQPSFNELTEEEIYNYQQREARSNANKSVHFSDTEAEIAARARFDYLRSQHYIDPLAHGIPPSSDPRWSEATPHRELLPPRFQANLNAILAARGQDDYKFDEEPETLKKDKNLNKSSIAHKLKM